MILLLHGRRAPATAQRGAQHLFFIVSPFERPLPHLELEVLNNAHDLGARDLRSEIAIAPRFQSAPTEKKRSHQYLLGVLCSCVLFWLLVPVSGHVGAHACVRACSGHRDHGNDTVYQSYAQILRFLTHVPRGATEPATEPATERGPPTATDRQPRPRPQGLPEAAVCLRGDPVSHSHGRLSRAR